MEEKVVLFLQRTPFSLILFMGLINTCNCLMSVAHRNKACEGTQSVIACENGIIAVHHANYGWRDLGICPHKTVTFLKSLVCVPDASNSVFSDRHCHISMYLEVMFSCMWILLLFLCQHGVEAKRAVVCEAGFMHLRCVSGLIKIIKANYGRTDRTTCSRGILAVHTSNMHCFQGSSLRIMSNRCDGRKSCYVPAMNTVFSDPCAWTYKYLDVDFICV